MSQIPGTVHDPLEAPGDTVQLTRHLNQGSLDPVTAHDPVNGVIRRDVIDRKRRRPMSSITLQRRSNTPIASCAIQNRAAAIAIESSSSVAELV